MSVRSPGETATLLTANFKEGYFTLNATMSMRRAIFSKHRDVFFQRFFPRGYQCH